MVNKAILFTTSNNFIIYFLKILLLLSAVLIFLSSCTSIDCPQCDEEKESNEDNLINLEEIYIIELHSKFTKKSKIENTNIHTFKSCTRPVLDINDDGTFLLTITEISQDNIKDIIPHYKSYDESEITKVQYKENSISFLNKYKNQLFLLDTTEIKYIGLASDVDVPPSLTNLPVVQFCACCIRDRSCIDSLTIFDKIEVRAMGGYRINANESIFYEGPFGGETYEKELLGFDRGGTDIILGLETAFLWDITPFLRKFINIPKRNSFHLGPMIGVWPVDESIFVPISLHPRYTFLYNETDKFNDQCNAWYIFGDFGVPFDPTLQVPIYCENCKDNKAFAYFYGLGIGRDWWMNKCMDFSIDLGFRVTNTPLPENIECEECTQGDDKFPYRKIGQVFLRFGLTW